VSDIEVVELAKALKLNNNSNKIKVRDNLVDIAIDWYPNWSTSIKIESGGRYPLGLNRFHNGLEDILIKSIVGNANRLRYISYCCWAIGDIERHENCTQYSDFVQAFRQRENALGIGLFLIKPSYSIDGITSLSKVVTGEATEYDCSFKLMQSNELGAFGLYYAGTIYNWGLTEINEKGIIILTEQGWYLHRLLEEYYHNLAPQYYKRFVGKRNIPVEVLLEWGRVNDFDNIRTPICVKERDFFKSLIFRLERKAAADYRRDTFTFFMECINRCSEIGINFSEDILRNIHYYLSFRDGTGSLHNFDLPLHYYDVQFFWSVYEGHVYFRWWLSCFFKVFLDQLKLLNNGSTIQGFLDGLDPVEFNRTIAAFCGNATNYLDKTMASVFNLISRPSSLLDPFSEEAITEDEEHNSLSGVLAKFVLITVNLSRKFERIRTDPRYQYLLASNLASDLWFNIIFSYLHLQETPIKEYLITVLKRHIINQHDAIMIEKNDLRRCWFTTENSRYFFQSDLSLIWRPAKYNTIMNFLIDMNLIDSNDKITTLSQEGKNFFAKLQRQYYQGT